MDVMPRTYTSIRVLRADANIVFKNVLSLIFGDKTDPQQLRQHLRTWVVNEQSHTPSTPQAVYVHVNSIEEVPTERSALLLMQCTCNYSFSVFTYSRIAIISGKDQSPLTSSGRTCPRNAMKRKQDPCSLG